MGTEDDAFEVEVVLVVLVVAVVFIVYEGRLLLALLLALRPFLGPSWESVEDSDSEPSDSDSE